MKPTRIHLVLAVLATVTAHAAEPKPPGDRRPPPLPQPLLVALDTNRDGELSPDEITNAPTALDALDKNGDGALSPKEIKGKPPKKKSGEAVPPPPDKAGPPPLIIKALDLDKDHGLSADEIEAASESLLILDKNNDGTLSRKELNPGKPPKTGDT
ncbi:MAG: hypothetical protein ABIT37_16830 [Luteolibacter sp.]